MSETIASLSIEDFKEILDGYFAQPQQRSKMSMDEVKDLAVRLNKKINIPIIREKKEEKILIKIIIKVDSFLYNNLPNELYKLVRDADNGIDDKEAKRLIKRLSKLANRKIDIPYIPEIAEYYAIRFVIGIIVNSLRKKWDYKKAADTASERPGPADGSAYDASDMDDLY